MKGKEIKLYDRLDKKARTILERHGKAKNDIIGAQGNTGNVIEKSIPFVDMFGRVVPGKYLKIFMPEIDYTHDYVIRVMNKSGQYCEEKDNEQHLWTAHNCMLKYDDGQLLELIYDKYHIACLSFIFKRSFKAMRAKIEQFGGDPGKIPPISQEAIPRVEPHTDLDEAPVYKSAVFISNKKHSISVLLMLWRPDQAERYVDELRSGKSTYERLRSVSHTDDLRDILIELRGRVNRLYAHKEYPKLLQLLTNCAYLSNKDFTLRAKKRVVIGTFLIENAGLKSLER